MKDVKRGYFVQALDKSLLLISENLCRCSLSKVFYPVIAVSLEVQYTVYIENGCKLFFIIFLILHYKAFGDSKKSLKPFLSLCCIFIFVCVCLYCCFCCLFVFFFFFQWCFFCALFFFVCIFILVWGFLCYFVLFLILHDLLKYFLLSNLEKFESLFYTHDLFCYSNEHIVCFFQCISVTDA